MNTPIEINDGAQDASVFASNDLLGKIACADALEVLREMPDNSVDFVFTDPPYKVSADYGNNLDADNLIGVAGVLRIFPELARVLKPGRFLACFYDNRILPLLFDAVRRTPLVYQRQVFVYRSNSVHAYRWHGWMNCTDPVCLFVKGGGERFKPTNPPAVKHDCYTRSKMNADRSGHPAQKPEDICEHIVGWCSDAGDVVLDPYTGGGSLLRAARLTGRQIIGIENNPKWHEVAKAHVALESGELILPNAATEPSRQ